MKHTKLALLALPLAIATLVTGCENLSSKKAHEPAHTTTQHADTRLADNAKFFSDNAKQAGVKTTASGLQYKVITAGTGDMVKAGDLAKVNYQAKLLNGEVVDATEGPAVVLVDDMIPGIAEGLKLTQAGGSYQFFVPADLAYPNTGSVEDNTALIYDVQVLEINPTM